MRPRAGDHGADHGARRGAGSSPPVVDEAKRFRHAHQLASYLGLLPLEDTSGERDKRRLGAITKQSNAYMRLRIDHIFPPPSRRSSPGRG
ncbi:transposase [Sorangium sp. So ce834]|uniref:transposase n=1 Tax=Sorangium sp. So ce834 TaxID=3133321 RepID=UPI003F6059C9